MPGGLRRVLAAASRAASPATDRDLLRRFADEGDQEAFTALVRRHTGLVLGVCRRGLRSHADAEDACQAVFVVLARKAASGRWQPSISGWLYSTALKVCRDTRRGAERRATREGRAAAREVATPIDQVTARELVNALDAELDRLPAIYREPLVLCYLDGLSREDAAARIGVPAGTVKIRLERGRKRLADALASRGMTLGAGLSLLALAAATPAGASAARLQESILAAVGGVPSESVAALAQGVNMNGALTTVKLVACVIGVAALGFGAASMHLAAEPQKGELPAQKSSAGGADGNRADAKDRPANAPADPTRTLRGTVTGHDGKPVAAEVLHLRSGSDPTVLGRANAKGEYAVTLPAAATGRQKSGLLVAWAKGYAVAIATKWEDPPAVLPFTLPADHPVRGRILDLEGKPVAGATVGPLLLTAAAAEQVDNFLAVWARMHPQESAFHQTERPDVTFGQIERFTLPDGRRLLSAKTDENGDFEITGLGAERVAELLVRGPGIADTHTLVVTRADFDPDPTNRAAGKARATYMLARPGPLPSAARVFGPRPTIAAEPEKPIRGVVTDATGAPRTGVSVTFQRLGEKGLELPRPHTAVTDKDGRFVLRGSGRYASYLIETAADPKGGYAASKAEAKDTPGLEPVEVRLVTVPTPPGK